jgi:hypothetical protein
MGANHPVKVKARDRNPYRPPLVLLGYGEMVIIQDFDSCVFGSNPNTSANSCSGILKVRYSTVNAKKLVRFQLPEPKSESVAQG